MKPKLLFIGHTFHKKTKSSQFMQDILARDYDIENFYFDPYTENINTAFKPLKGKKYDVLVLWQIMPDVDKLKKCISFERAAFFPMYDGVPPRDDKIWYSYRDVNIINFSKTLHQELQDLGFSSYYFQYFPKPIKIKNPGDEKSIFFWQRTNAITIDTVGKLIDLKKMKHIHMHHAIDPCHTFVEPGPSIAKKVTTSTWFDTREEMQDKMQESAIYIAPRAFEGIGMSFLEAMAMGRVVIAPNYPTMNEYITDGENGILYDLNNPQPVDLKSVHKIQKNTEKYIRDGYKKWEQEKWNIIDILVKTPIADYRKLKSNYISRKSYPINNKYYLFDMIPMLRVVGCQTRLVYKLFDLLPVLMIKGDQNRRRIYICGIPVLKIKR